MSASLLEFTPEVGVAFRGRQDEGMKAPGFRDVEGYTPKFQTKTKELLFADRHISEAIEEESSRAGSESDSCDVRRSPVSSQRPSQARDDLLPPAPRHSGVSKSLTSRHSGSRRSSYRGSIEEYPVSRRGDSPPEAGRYVESGRSPDSERSPYPRRSPDSGRSERQRSRESGSMLNRSIKSSNDEEADWFVEASSEEFREMMIPIILAEIERLVTATYDVDPNDEDAVMDFAGIVRWGPLRIKMRLPDPSVARGARFLQVQKISPIKIDGTGNGNNKAPTLPLRGNRRKMRWQLSHAAPIEFFLCEDNHSPMSGHESPRWNDDTTSEGMGALCCIARPSAALLFNWVLPFLSQAGSRLQQPFRTVEKRLTFGAHDPRLMKSQESASDHGVSGGCEKGEKEEKGGCTRVDDRKEKGYCQGGKYVEHRKPKEYNSKHVDDDDDEEEEEESLEQIGNDQVCCDAFVVLSENFGILVFSRDEQPFTDGTPFVFKYLLPIRGVEVREIASTMFEVKYAQAAKIEDCQTKQTLKIESLTLTSASSESLKSWLTPIAEIAHKHRDS